MAKRVATSELNHDNWDEDIKPEEAGVFTKAPAEVLEKRVLKTARRRLAPSNREESGKSAFSGLSAFKATSTPNPSPFSFLAKTNTNSPATPLKTLGGNSESATTNGASKNSENGTNKKEEPAESSAEASSATSKTEKENDNESKKPSEYFAKLKGLNESVTQWIKTHVDANPFCILTPIFKDYEKYLKEIEAKHGGEAEKTTGNTSEQMQTASKSVSSAESINPEKKQDSIPFGSAATKSFAGVDKKPEKSIFGYIDSNIQNIFAKRDQAPDFSKSVFGSPETGESPKSIFGNTDKTSPSIFGKLNTEKNPFLNKPSTTLDSKSEDETKSDVKTTSMSLPTPPSSTPIFSFGQSSNTSSASAGFSFGSAKPFSFAAQSVKPPEAEEKEDEVKEEEDEEPPKPEFKPVTEEGSIYDQRCKVFVKKDGNFSTGGVGVLFLKPTPNGKTQLIVRAETSLGNLILNTLLTESMPIKRMNKNTIMLVCLPKPDSLPPPVPVLLRVKTDEDADVLFENLNKHKK